MKNTLTLAWLQQHPSKWTTYIANRVSEVQTALSGATWHYVSSKENPADCAFRGLSASMLLPHDLWWNGPAWLKRSSTMWPKRDLAMSVDETASKEISTEARKVIIQHVDCTREWELPHRYSSWARLVRVTAYALRFIGHSRRGRSSQPKRGTLLKVSELHDAAHRWFQLVQKVHFSKEWSALHKNEPIPNSSALKDLKPMLGKDSLLRLGGRLHNATLEYDEKHPIILPKHRTSELLINCAHRATLHGGTQFMLHHLRQQY